MDSIDESPWCVSNLDEFIYYCCPECDKRNKSEDSFLKHVLGEHPEAQKYIEKLTTKDELFRNQNHIGNLVKNPKAEKIDCEPNLNHYIKQEFVGNDFVEINNEFIENTKIKFKDKDEIIVEEEENFDDFEDNKSDIFHQDINNDYDNEIKIKLENNEVNHETMHKGQNVTEYTLVEVSISDKICHQKANLYFLMRNDLYFHMG